MLAVAGLFSTAFVGCDDDETPAAPTIVTPEPTVKIASATDITFEIITPGGYKSSDVTATNGSVMKTEEPATGDTSGEIVVAFSAPESHGTSTITLTVTDNNNKVTTSTTTVTITSFETVVVSGILSGTQNWTADKIYELQGRVIVANGAELNIEAGTVIKGQEGTASNAAVLMIARGGKLNANGTAAAPIIMTSVLDNILPGQTTGTSLTLTDRGKWGGLVILGRAPISVSGSTEAQIEGVPASETQGLYGGDVANDNSGTVTYVSIRHGGTVIAEGNEINGLTLGGVGSGTTISNIEVFSNEDDGIEFFGGSVNASNLLVAYQGDDAIDIDQAYSGTINGFYVIHGGSTDEGLEIDGPEGTANATGKFTLTNGTLVGDPTQAGDAASLADFKARAQGTISNVIFKGYPNGKAVKIAANYNASCAAGSANAYSNLIANELVFTNIQLTNYLVSVYSANTANCATPPAADQTAAQGKVTSTTVTNGIPAVATWDWTVSKEKSLIQ